MLAFRTGKSEYAPREAGSVETSSTLRTFESVVVPLANQMRRKSDVHLDKSFHRAQTCRRAVDLAREIAALEQPPPGAL